MLIDVTCIRCGVEWRPDRDDYRVGTWKTCPACRRRSPARDRPADHPDTTRQDTTRQKEDMTP